MRCNFASRDHEIIVFVENDAPLSIAFLLTQKEHFANLRILCNKHDFPIGYQRNINHMFSIASNDIVSYMQSDMVPGPLYDVEILKYLTPNIILSGSRCEPPLHPPSSEKHTIDFGLTPDVFDLDAFNAYANKVRCDKITDFFFAPFTLYKETWNKIGGHDVMFRRSREDSDVLWRLLLNGTEVKQCWNAIVYHFSCTSSRGENWWKTNSVDVQRRNALQMKADEIEMMKFIRKWGSFRHPSSITEAKHYKYNVSAALRNCDDHCLDVLIHMIPLFQRIYVDNPSLQYVLQSKYDALQKPANNLLNFSEADWSIYGKHYHQVPFEDIFKFSGNIEKEDVLLELDMHRVLVDPQQSYVLSNLQPILHESIAEGDSGDFEVDGIMIHIYELRNRIMENVVVHNPDFDMHIEEL